MVYCHKLLTQKERNFNYAKPTFTDEFKQVSCSVCTDHPDESKLSIAKRF